MSVITEQYKQARKYKPPELCGYSTPEPRKDLALNQVHHAGVVTHVCALLKKHEQTHCECACGYQWQTWNL